MVVLTVTMEVLFSLYVERPSAPKEMPSCECTAVSEIIQGHRLEFSVRSCGYQGWHDCQLLQA